MNHFKKLENDMLIVPQPTEADFQQARQLGIKTILDLRFPSETPKPNAEWAADLQKVLDFASFIKSANDR